MSQITQLLLFSLFVVGAVNTQSEALLSNTSEYHTKLLQLSNYINHTISSVACERDERSILQYSQSIVRNAVQIVADEVGDFQQWQAYQNYLHSSENVDGSIETIDKEAYSESTSRKVLFPKDEQQNQEPTSVEYQSVNPSYVQGDSHTDKVESSISSVYQSVNPSYDQIGCKLSQYASDFTKAISDTLAIASALIEEQWLQFFHVNQDLEAKIQGVLERDGVDVDALTEVLVSHQDFFEGVVQILENGRKLPEVRGVGCDQSQFIYTNEEQ